MHNVMFHIVDIGNKEDMKMVANLMTSDFGENEYMIRNNEIFVSRLLPLSPAEKDTNSSDTIMYPLLIIINK